MGEIFGGIIVIILFIGFILWKAKNKEQGSLNSLREQENQEYWAEKNDSTPDIVSADSSDDE